jgi:hypothetical protein
MSVLERLFPCSKPISVDTWSANNTRSSRIRGIEIVLTGNAL